VILNEGKGKGGERKEDNLMRYMFGSKKRKEGRG